MFHAFYALLNLIGTTYPSMSDGMVYLTGSLLVLVPSLALVIVVNALAIRGANLLHRATLVDETPAEYVSPSTWRYGADAATNGHRCVDCGTDCNGCLI